VSNVTISKNAKSKAEKYQIRKKFDKQVRFLRVNPQHNSLNLKPLKSMSANGIWEFRIDRHYRGLVIKRGTNSVEVYDVIKHLK